MSASFPTLSPSPARGDHLHLVGADPALDVLSRRELEVMRLVALGRSNVEIAETLFLGTNTVKTYLRSAYRKVGVASRAAAVVWAIAHDLHPDLGRRTDA